jgi:ATP synthase protein I
MSQPKAVSEYDRLQTWLTRVTLIISAGACALCGWVYGFNVAVSYLLGATVGLLYLQLLARSVRRLGQGSRNPLLSSRLLLVVALFILVVRWPTLHLLPAILGFLTYKLTILLYTIHTVLTGGDGQTGGTALGHQPAQPTADQPLTPPPGNVLSELTRLRAEQHLGEEG